MKSSLLIGLGATLITFLFSCAFAPVNNQYEKAGTLKKGNVELSGNLTSYSASGSGGSEHTNTNYGFRAGIGLTDKFDLKLRYERLMPANSFGDEENFGEGDIKSVNYFSFVPKFAVIPDKLSFLVPFSYYSYKENIDGEEDEGSFSSIAPQLIYTLTNSRNTADLSFGLKADCLLGGNGGGGVLLGTTIGGGFSTDLNKWAIRPEVGALFIGGGAFLSYGIGLQLILSKNNKTHNQN